ncbi:uncharacterized protein LOC116070098 isoform X3 [Mastomys coucha]|uniref:uncharacterized protein LOC116070098 isoform X3 n=1 Tax=Mastomys coucha TaxID=35658 RepID=UPI0012623A23|nr:uncharacterized protein LOC116070098 isoform X3 [Mastomys coucha]
MVISAARTRPINSPGPPLLNKTKASPIALTSGGAQEGARRGAAHAAPPSSLRPGLPRGSSSRVGDGCSGRRSGIRSLPRTQHLERRTAPRLIPLTPPPSSCSSQWKRRIRPGGCPLGGPGPSVGTSSPEAARVFALPAGTCSLLGMWWSGLVPRAADPKSTDCQCLGTSQLSVGQRPGPPEGKMKPTFLLCQGQSSSVYFSVWGGSGHILPNPYAPKYWPSPISDP